MLQIDAPPVENFWLRHWGWDVGGRRPPLLLNALEIFIHQTKYIR